MAHQGSAIQKQGSELKKEPKFSTKSEAFNQNPLINEPKLKIKNKTSNFFTPLKGHFDPRRCKFLSLRKFLSSIQEWVEE